MDSSQVADKSQKCSHPSGEACSNCSNCSSEYDGEIFDRKKLLTLTSSLIQETHDRISGDRFRVREGDKEKLQYIRALSGLIALHTSLLEKSRAPDLKALESVYNPDPLDDLMKW